MHIYMIHAKNIIITKHNMPNVFLGNIKLGLLFKCFLTLGTISLNNASGLSL